MKQTTLFGHELVDVSAIRTLREVEVENTSVAKYVVDAEGRKWVGKAYVDTGLESIAAEALSWSIAMELGARVPLAGHHGALHDDTFVWLSGYVADSIHWAAEHANFIANLDELGAMLAVDVLVMNEDRHARNILLTPENGMESRLTAWAIDFGNAIIAYPADYLSRADEIPSTRNLARGLPTTLLRRGAMAAAAKASSMCESPHIGTYVATAARLVEESRGADILTALTRRMRGAEELVDRYLKSIEGMT